MNWSLSFHPKEKTSELFNSNKVANERALHRRLRWQTLFTLFVDGIC